MDELKFERVECPNFKVKPVGWWSFIWRRLFRRSQTDSLRQYKIRSFETVVDTKPIVEMGNSSDEKTFEKSIETPATPDRTAEYVNRSDSLWFKQDNGEFVKICGLSFKRCEDQE